MPRRIWQACLIIFPVNNVMREDVVTNGDGSKDTLANAPEANEYGFIVPKTVE